MQNKNGLRLECVQMRLHAWLCRSMLQRFSPDEDVLWRTVTCENAKATMATLYQDETAAFITSEWLIYEAVEVTFG